MLSFLNAQFYSWWFLILCLFWYISQAKCCFFPPLFSLILNTLYIIKCFLAFGHLARMAVFIVYEVWT